jgi:PAS domain S-box-containing protein
MKVPLSVLLLDDSEDDTLLLLREFERSSYELTFKRVETAQSMRDALSEREWDIIISDYAMPSFDALGALQVLKESRLDIPFIIVSGTIGEERAVQAMRLGAVDFFQKGKLGLLIPAVEREINDSRERQQRRQFEADLYQAEERFVKAFHTSPIATSICTAEENRFVDVNERFLVLTGYNREEVIGHTSLELGLWSESAADALRMLHEQSEIRDFETDCHTKSGEIRYVLASLEALKIGGDQFVLSMFQDITDRRLAEAHMLNLNRQLEERNHELIAIQEVGRILSSTLDIQGVYQTMYREVAQKILDVPNFTVALFDDVNQIIRCGYSVVDGVERDIDEFPDMPMGTGPTSQAILTQQPRIVNMETEMASMSARGRMVLVGDNDLSPKSALYVPLITGGKVVGVMSFQHYHADAFLTTDVLFISTLASQAAIALKNAQLYETIRDNAAELKSLYNATSYLFKSDSVLNLGYQIVQAVVQEFGKADCGLIMFDKQENSVIRVARSGSYHVEPMATLDIDGPGLIPETLRTGNTVYAPDVAVDPRYVPNHPTTRSELVVPLRSTGGIIGALDLQSIERDAFSERDIRILQAFAERVAAAIENMQLYEEVNHYAGELEWRVAKRTAELHRSKERVEAILSNSSDAIILTDDKMTIHQANPAFNQLFGQSPDEVFGKPLSILFQSDQAGLLAEVTNRILETRQSERVELIGLRKDGSRFNADIALALTLQQETDDMRLIYSMRDITARKEIEKNLRRSLEQEKELSELKSRFVSMASHEFRTPLATVQSSSDLLMLYHERMTEERRLEHLGKIQFQVKHLTGLIDDILTLYKAESVGLNLNPVAVEIEPFMREIVSQMQSIAPQHIIHFSSAALRDPVKIDDKLMRQAVTNLLSNAVKYSKGGDSVYVKLEHDEGKRLMIHVRDQGIGIPPEDQMRLFQSFHRAKNVGSIPGTGLGLAIVKQAVEAHGGRVLFESEVGVGTTFTIIIPIRPEVSDSLPETSTA